MTKDTEVFGTDTLVYCKQHMRPHATGWCTVFPEEKIALAAIGVKEAYVECRSKGYPLYGETPNTRPYDT